MCTDTAAVKVKLYKLLKPDMAEHYLLTLCPGHKVELALSDTFKISNLNACTEKDYRDIYYFFKKSPLRWKLSKEVVEKEFITILTKLAEVPKDPFSCFSEDTTFHAMTTLLDTKAYVHTDLSDLYEAVNEGKAFSKPLHFRTIITITQR